MGIENIHEIRKSFMALQNLVRRRFTEDMWLTSLESTGWLGHIRTILKASVYIVTLIKVREEEDLLSFWVFRHFCSQMFSYTERKPCLSAL